MHNELTFKKIKKQKAAGSLYQKPAALQRLWIQEVLYI